jgi:hypothetical protein
MLTKLVFSITLCVLLFASGLVRGQQPINTADYDKLRALIKPQAGEAKWLDIPWEIDVQQARKKAAAEGKPIFFLTGGGKSPLGDC